MHATQQAHIISNSGQRILENIAGNMFWRGRSRKLFVGSQDIMVFILLQFTHKKSVHLFAEAINEDNMPHLCRCSSSTATILIKIHPY
jgi:hypothetical protein